jgi:hypothetical protein
MVRGVPLEPEATQGLLERIAFIRNTHYGMKLFFIRVQVLTTIRRLLGLYLGFDIQRYCVYIRIARCPYRQHILL